jgi:hypothetical protein
MRRGLLLLLGASLSLVACASADEEAGSTDSDVVESVSPLDKVTYAYELVLRDEPERSDCDYLVTFHTEFSGEGADHNATVTKKDRVLTGTLTLDRYIRRFTGLDVRQHCIAANEDIWPVQNGYEGIAKMNVTIERTAPGPMVPVSMVADHRLIDVAGKSLKMSLASVQKSPAITDVNCGQMAPGSSDRFFIKTVLTSHDVGPVYARTVTLDGDGAVLPKYDSYEFFSYCRDKSKGHPNDVQVKIDLIQKKVFRDEKFDSGEAITVAANTQGDITHRGSTTLHSKVIVLR